MGVLEQILEANKNLSEQVAFLSNSIASINTKIDSIQNNDKLKLEFSDDEKLNASLTARILGIKQRELEDILNKGLLQSVGERKRIFLVKDIIDYLHNKNIQNKDYFIVRKKNKKQKRNRSLSFKDIVSQNDIDELMKINS